jgi:hypothetical protein
VFLVAAALPLLIGRAERHAWAVRGWTLAVVSWGLAWLAERGDAPFALPPVDLLLAPAAVGLALATAMGVAAFEVDLPGYRFGWRQLASGLAAAAVALGTIPVLGAAFDGRWSMPAGDHRRALGFIDAEQEDLPFRVLWLGDPADLPLGSWQLEDGVAYATTDEGTPEAQDLWVGSDDGRTALISDVVELARDGQTARLGRLLAPMGIRYVVVPERLAPAPFATEHRPLPEGFMATLDAQLDMEPLDVPAGLSVFRNEAFCPPRAAVSQDQAPTDDAGASSAAALDLSAAALALPDGGGHLRWTGPVEGDTTVLFSASHSKRWRLEVDGEAVPHTKPFGWANGFTIAGDGGGTLSFDTPPLRYAALGLQALVWIWVIRRLMRWRANPRPEPVEEP